MNLYKSYQNILPLSNGRNLNEKENKNYMNCKNKQLKFKLDLGKE